MASAAPPPGAPFLLRAVRDEADLASMASLYADAVRSTTATWAYAEEAPTAADFAARWAAARARALPWVVAVDAADAARVVGYATVGDFRARLGWRFTAEHAVYVAPAWARRGVGRALLGAVVAGARAAGVATLVAVISTHAPTGAGAASVALHRAVGFERAGALRGAGTKGGLVLDAEWYALALQPIPAEAVGDARAALV
jgi:L-amino acid N-acyltransferase YncA